MLGMHQESVVMVVSFFLNVFFQGALSYSNKWRNGKKQVLGNPTVALKAG